MKKEEKPGFNLTRRALAPLGVASLIGMWFARPFLSVGEAASRASRAAGEGQKVAAPVSLPSDQAAAYAKRMLTTNKNLARFHEYFGSKGYQFVLERARVFMVEAGANGESSYAVAILPSLVTAKRTDSSHSAVSLVGDSRGLTVATGATIQHNPFQVSEFKLYEIGSSGGVEEHTISADELAKLTPHKAADLLGGAGKGQSHSDMKILARRNEIVASTLFSEWINDRYARPLYPEEGLRAMLAQGPLTDKFATVVAIRLGRDGGSGGCIAAGLSLCLCCSSSSNACTSSSWIGDLL